MKRDSNTYIFIYSIAMVVVVAVLLALASTALKPAQLENVRMEKRLDILKSIGLGDKAEGASDKMAVVNSLYDQYIVKDHVVNGLGKQVSGCRAFDIDLRGELTCTSDQMKLPVFEAKLDNGEIKYVFPLTGQGLWGPIWGYLALNDDMNTVYGVSFSHKGETPGLGAEITNPAFTAQFPGKQIFKDGQLCSIKVLKGGDASQDPWAVDGVSGGTLTSRGLEKMLRSCLTEYKSFLEARRKGGQK